MAIYGKHVMSRNLELIKCHTSIKASIQDDRSYKLYDMVQHGGLWNHLWEVGISESDVLLNPKAAD